MSSYSYLSEREQVRRHMADQRYRMRALNPCKACLWIALGLAFAAGVLLGVAL